MEKREKMLPLNLQFFAENGEEGNDGNDGGSGETTFTQSQVSAMMAKEKKEGKRSAFKALGFDNEEEAVNAMNDYKEYLKTKKSKEEILGDDLKNANSDKDKALTRAKLAEEKLSLFMAGVDKDSFEDVLAIANGKITDDKDLDSVLEDMKKQDRYKSFFVGKSKDDDSSGTGSDLGHGSNNGDDDKPGSYGEMLAKQNARSATKNSYFS